MVSQPTDDHQAADLAQVLVITPAHNEADRLESLAASVARQSLQPSRWIIVDDRSTDETGAVARRLSDQIHFADHLIRVGTPERSFPGKVAAFTAGYEQGRTASHDFIVCLDADVELPANYLEEVVRAFRSDSTLGICGGVYIDPSGRVGRHRGLAVPGPAQMFRRETFEKIGGYQPLAFGGEDALVCIYARMHGWTTRPLPGLHFRHSRRMGGGGGRTRVGAAYYHGRQDWDLGVDPVFELLRLAPRVFSRPYVIGTMARLAGYVRGAMDRRRTLDREVVDFSRREQRLRLFGGLKRSFMVGKN